MWQSVKASTHTGAQRILQRLEVLPPARWCAPQDFCPKKLAFVNWLAGQ